jgi:solute carrier family 9B (sodium/hydrogen exchanger), member 1/2
MIFDLALIFIGGIALYQLANWLQLPKVIFFMLLGMMLGAYGLNLLDPVWDLIGTDLRQLALLIIIIRAGLALNLKDLKQVGLPSVLLGFVPATVDMISVMMLSHFILNLPILEAWLLGAIVSAVSPAIVVPFMLEMIKKGIGQSSKLPQMIMAGSSLDDVYAIMMFTLALSVNAQGALTFEAFFAVPLSLLIGVVVGILLGKGLVSLFKKIHVRDSYKVIFIMGIALLLSHLENVDIIPFSSLVSVLALSMTLLIQYPVLAHRLVLKFEKVWLLNELLLFVLIGSIVNLSILPKIGLDVILILMISLVLRSVGTYISLWPSSLTLEEKRFTIISYLPKATVQASIGALPLALGMPSGELILAFAVMSILLTAPLGAVLMQWSIKKASII